MKASVPLWQQLWLELSFLWVSRLDLTFEGDHTKTQYQNIVFTTVNTLFQFPGVGGERVQELLNWGKVAQLWENALRMAANMGTSQQIHACLTALSLPSPQWSLACCAWGDTSSGETGNGRIPKAWILIIQFIGRQQKRKMKMKSTLGELPKLDMYTQQ